MIPASRTPSSCRPASSSASGWGSTRRVDRRGDEFLNLLSKGGNIFDIRLFLMMAVSGVAVGITHVYVSWLTYAHKNASIFALRGVHGLVTLVGCIALIIPFQGYGAGVVLGLADMFILAIGGVWVARRAFVFPVWPALGVTIAAVLSGALIAGSAAWAGQALVAQFGLHGRTHDLAALAANAIVLGVVALPIFLKRKRILKALRTRIRAILDAAEPAGDPYDPARRHHPLLAVPHARRREGAGGAVRDVPAGGHLHPCAGPGKTLPVIQKHRIETTFISRMPMARKLYQKYLPFMPRALEELDLNAYDLVISSEAGPAKGVIARPDALHICYTHSPMRYLWDQYHIYFQRAGGFTKLVMPHLVHELRKWDVTSAARVDAFAANSNHVAKRIRKYWRRESTVVFPRSPSTASARCQPASVRRSSCGRASW
ncbi:hypothetical protein [Hankyongella ginsenosidimutans]|uniref:hypothetical protein n=1 Tax=Hankyongella ginsenosidimutans TaxID=1763828 RepID=UPI001FE4C531|nr:hypothetical protein [Hankyongella ginsenosidimutans]